MIVLVGASASGKTELSKILFQTFGYKKVITTTTRGKRNNEIDGQDYHFIDKETFESFIKENAFYEVTLYQDNYYGIQKKDVIENALVIVDPNGANTLIKAIKDVFVVYVESSEALRMDRMRMRGESEETIHKRISGDKLTFDLKQFIKIDLHLYNEKVSLHKLAEVVHEAYQLR